MSLQNRMNKTAQKIDAITQKMKSMEAPTIKTDSFKALEAELEKAQSEMQALIAEQNQWEAAGISSGNAWDTLNNKIADAEEKVFGISAKMDEMKNSGDAFTNSVNTDAYQKLQQDLQNANADMAVLNKKSEELALKTKETGNAPDGLLGKLKQMKEVLGGVVSKVSDGVKKGVNGLKKIKNSIGGVLSKLKNLRAGANKTSSGFSNLLKTMRQMVLSMAVFQAMSKGVEFLKSGLQNLAVYSKEYNKNMSALVSSTGMLKNSLAVAFAPIISAVIPYLVSLPRLANGGITTGATLAEIGEAGREAVLPLENNTGWMDELAGKLASRMPTYNTPTTLVMEVDGKAFAKCELPYFNAESQRIGVRLVTG